MKASEATKKYGYNLKQVAEGLGERSEYLSDMFKRRPYRFYHLLFGFVQSKLSESINDDMKRIKSDAEKEK